MMKDPNTHETKKENDFSNEQNLSPSGADEAVQDETALAEDLQSSLAEEDAAADEPQSDFTGEDLTGEDSAQDAPSEETDEPDTKLAADEAAPSEPESEPSQQNIAKKFPVKLTPRLLITVAAAIIFAAMLFWGVWRMAPKTPGPSENGETVSYGDVNASGWSIQMVKQDYEPGKLVLTTDRQEYLNGSMELRVPFLNVDVPIQKATDSASLDLAPGLYKYSQIPEPFKNGNVSIFGHRDIAGMEFYYIDQMEEGHLIYLIYQEKIFVYVYDSVVIVPADDHSPTAVREFASVTLASCDPIGSIKNRICVIGRLIDVVDFDPEYVFASRVTQE